jgi:hypothetical protein
VDSALRRQLLEALDFDLAIAGNCTPAVAEGLIAGAGWWDRICSRWLHG